MLELLISLLILLLVIVVVRHIVDAMGLPGNVRTIVWLILAVFFLIVLLNYLGLLPLSWPARRI